MTDPSKDDSAKVSAQQVQAETRAQQVVLSKATEKLAKNVAALNSSVAEAVTVRDELATVVADNKRSRKYIFGLAASFALDLVLTIAMAFSFVGLAHNSARLDTVTQRLDVEQRVQKDQALCPLFQIFQDATEPAIRAASENVPGYEKDKILKSFDAIHKVYAALNCKELLEGK